MSVEVFPEDEFVVPDRSGRRSQSGLISRRDNGIFLLCRVFWVLLDTLMLRWLISYCDRDETMGDYVIARAADPYSGIDNVREG